VLELRRSGYAIEMYWHEQETDAGKMHRVAKYIVSLRPSHIEGVKEGR